MSNPISTERVPLDKMYEEYFLDYASYVILERAVPKAADGLKPVQRRILYSMKKMHDGRYHKVANVIGQTMSLHPHGDAAIGAALVNLGQKDLLIDCQGNWGDVRTGDSAAAPRYIEARLTPFALDVLFNADTTDWQQSYDGRNKEPISLPAKFPLVLSQGVEGIAVGLATKILPHNFNELIKASIKILEGKKVKIYPDFQTGGLADVADYQDGHRGGKVKVRAKIEKQDKSTIVVRELPYGVTTTQLIDSILKANDKGKIKIKGVRDNTAKDVEIIIDLAPGMSPDIAIDALYAFTSCEVSISPNACVIIDNKPHFLSVLDLLHFSTQQTKDLLGMELELKKKELEEKWHFASLEKIFIQERIYRDMEECESWEEVLHAVLLGLHKYVKTPSNAKPNSKKLQLHRDITDEDITKLTEIKIKRISKYNVFKAEEALVNLLEELKEVKHHIAHLTEYAIAFYNDLFSKYSKGQERRTELTSFEEIKAQQVVINNTTLYVNRKEGFIGYGLKKDEEIGECSDIDDIIVMRKDGVLTVSRISEKTFVGKNIIHVAVWKKGDQRTTYNMIYKDGIAGKTMVKRFQISAITRDKEYDLTSGAKGSQVLYLTANPNGEAEIVEVKLTASSRARIKKFEYDFFDLAIKGRGSKGNMLTKYNVQSVKLVKAGESTLDALKYYLDKKTGRIKTKESDLYLGSFHPEDICLAIYKDGTYELIQPLENRKIDIKSMVHLTKYAGDKTIISFIYYDGLKKWTMVKRFNIETTSLDQRHLAITEHEKSELLFASINPKPSVQFSYTSLNERITDVVHIADFIDVKGWKAMGNRLVDRKVKIGKELKRKTLKPGDSIEFDLKDAQGELF
jgi:topoisomerase-4 subunit A